MVPRIEFCSACCINDLGRCVPLKFEGRITVVSDADAAAVSSQISSIRRQVFYRQSRKGFRIIVDGISTMGHNNYHRYLSSLVSLLRGASPCRLDAANVAGLRTSRTPRGQAASTIQSPSCRHHRPTSQFRTAKRYFKPYKHCRRWRS
jgi:hypothetical protein